MATTISTQFEGIRNLVVTVRITTTTAGAIVVDATTLSIPCRTFSIRKIIYDVGTGNVAFLYFGPAQDRLILLMSPGNGQTVDINQSGGASYNVSPTNQIISVDANVTGTDGITFVLYLVKKY